MIRFERSLTPSYYRSITLLPSPYNLESQITTTFTVALESHNGPSFHSSTSVFPFEIFREIFQYVDLRTLEAVKAVSRTCGIIAEELASPILPNAMKQTQRCEVQVHSRNHNEHLLGTSVNKDKVLTSAFLKDEVGLTIDVGKSNRDMEGSASASRVGDVRRSRKSSFNRNSILGLTVPPAEV